MNILFGRRSEHRRISKALKAHTAFMGACATFACLSPRVSAVEAPFTEEQKREKEQYTLFHPTPDSLLRPLSTDRPDKTESPYTVDAGHFQLEMDFITYTYDRYHSGPGNSRIEAFSLAPMNLKVGLCNSADFQLIIEPYNHLRIHDLDTGFVANQSGFGDLFTRLKVNLWGNDGGSTAFAVMPFLKLPTNQDHLGNNAVEGGLIFPLSVELPRGWEMGFMPEFDFNSNLRSSGYHTEYIQTITFSHDIFGKLSGYVEFFSALSLESHAPWVSTIDFGLTYLITKNVQLDAGVNVGITRAADDINPFTGISVRF
jgi:Putative MetA-pathway of phenol degradation